ncbi:hypothetical protein C8R43DRAFT_504993 [Mycena crocata]|nr:hypothetical protein C8R43DRAFT_504993 [Mycena crocata]
MGLRPYVTLALFPDSLAFDADGYRSMHPPCGSHSRLPTFLILSVCVSQGWHPHSCCCGRGFRALSLIPEGASESLPVSQRTETKYPRAYVPGGPYHYAVRPRFTVRGAGGMSNPFKLSLRIQVNTAVTIVSRHTWTAASYLHHYIPWNLRS